jgi:hypothetical protein
MSNPNPNIATRFAPGNRLGGRPLGARARLGEKFQQALADDFERHGDAVIKIVRSEDPSTYLGIVAKLQPREVEAKLQIEQRIPGNLPPEAWEALKGVWEAIEAAGASGFPPEQVFQLIEHTLRAELAKPIEPAPALVSVDPGGHPEPIAAAIPAPPF